MEASYRSEWECHRSNVWLSEHSVNAFLIKESFKSGFSVTSAAFRGRSVTLLMKTTLIYPDAGATVTETVFYHTHKHTRAHTVSLKHRYLRKNEWMISFLSHFCLSAVLYLISALLWFVWYAAAMHFFPILYYFFIQGRVFVFFYSSDCGFESFWVRMFVACLQVKLSTARLTSSHFSINCGIGPVLWSRQLPADWSRGCCRAATIF